MDSLDIQGDFNTLNPAFDALSLKARAAAKRRTGLKNEAHQEFSSQDGESSGSSDESDEWHESILRLPSSKTRLVSTSTYTRRKETHRFLSDHPSILQELLAVFQSWLQHAGDTSGTSASGSTSSANSPNTASTGISPRAQAEAGSRRGKRSSNANADEDQDEDEPGQGGSRKRSRKNRSPGYFHRSLACPFAKKDPARYHECYKNRITRIQDVKQHLRRFHEPPIYCLICKDTFKSEAELQTHAEARSCTLRPEKVDGVDRDQKERLSKNVDRKLSTEDQWYSIFDILFPGFDPRPRSPYVEGSVNPVLLAFQDFMTHQGPSVLLASLQARDLVTSSPGDQKRLLLATLAEGLEAIGDGWNSRLRSDDSTQSPNRSGPLPSLPQSGPTSSSPSTPLINNGRDGANPSSHVSPLQTSLLPVVNIPNGPTEVEPRSHSNHDSGTSPGNAPTCTGTFQST